MAEFSEAFKSKMVQRMLGPNGMSANALSAQANISQTTLSRWKREAQATMLVMPKKVTSPKTAPVRRAEDWSSEERLRVVDPIGIGSTRPGAVLEIDDGERIGSAREQQAPDRRVDVAVRGQ